jgi:hypothetical protein
MYIYSGDIELDIEECHVIICITFAQLKTEPSGRLFWNDYKISVLMKEASVLGVFTDSGKALRHPFHWLLSYG